MKLSLLLTIALAPSAATQDATYELKMDWRPVKGHRTKLDETFSMKITFNSEGHVVNTAGGTTFSALETVLSVDSDGGSEREWAFSKASQIKEDKPQVLGFQGKNVRVKHVKGKPLEFALEGGTAIEETDLAELRKAFAGYVGSRHRPNLTEMFAPKKPVKVGESWSTDPKAFAVEMGHDIAGSLDYGKSSSMFTLKSVERRDGTEFGRIDGVVELSIVQIGEMRVEPPAVMKFSMTADVCIDRNLPDAVLDTKAVIKVKATGIGPKAKVDLDWNAVGEGRIIAQTVK